MNSTYAEARRGKLVEILADKSSPREQRIERVARFVEEEVRSAFSRGVRQGRRGGPARGPVRGRLVREDIEVDATLGDQDEL
jgi:hypothetical protein